MPELTFGVVGAGDMGSGVGAALVRAGFPVLTDLSGRSADSGKLANEAGMRDAGSLEALLGEADVVLSIVPPAAARQFAASVLEHSAKETAVFADCNAVAPEAVLAMARAFEAAGRTFLDVGIVGPRPRPDVKIATRIYVSGPMRALLLDLPVAEMMTIDMGAEIGRASAIKMAYASINKGVDAMLTAILLAAGRLGVREALFEELERSQQPLLERMRGRIPYLAATAERFAPEMREIVASLEAVDITPRFHEAAGWLYEQLSRTGLAAETRATLPADRSLEEALASFERDLGRGGR